jgi:hypothetical protein
LKEDEAKRNFESFLAKKRKLSDISTEEKKRFRPWEQDLKQEEISIKFGCFRIDKNCEGH